MNKILLLTDFSDNATQAIQYAFKLWQGKPCEFYVLNVQKSSDFTTDDLLTAKPHESIFTSIIADNKSALDAYIETLRPFFEQEDFTVIPKVDYDVFTDSVNQVISNYRIEYVVLGTNGASGARESLFGSNALQVIRKVDCPTLIVPEGFEFRPLKEILYTQTEQIQPSPQQLEPVVRLLTGRGSSVHLLGIHPGTEMNLGQLEQDLNQLAEVPFGVLETEAVVESLKGLPVPQAISAYEQLNEVDLHVFIVQQESLLSRFLNGSDNGKISHKTPVPLLVLHDN
ncbi:universal stress protein [Gilvibacter sp.]|uniref:universal stress protein n=1 Tax=Gilvibacter sp. TaxID=2729997 RepID=UPI003F4A723B